MDTKKRSPIDRLLFATFLKGRTSSRDVWEEKGDMTPEDNQKIIEETNEIINNDSTIPSSATCPTCLPNPNPPMKRSRSCTTASTKLPPHWGRTAPMCSVRSLQS